MNSGLTAFMRLTLDLASRAESTYIPQLTGTVSTRDASCRVQVLHFVGIVAFSFFPKRQSDRCNLSRQCQAG